MMRFAAWYRKVSMAFTAVAAVSLAIMIVSTSLDTIFRYSINYPIAGVFELNEVLLVVAVFFGITWTQSERGHTRVVILMRRMPIRLAVKMDIVCWILCFLFLAILGLQSGKEALYSFRISEFRWGSVQMPIWWAKACVPLGCWMTCVQLLIDIWVDIGRLRGIFPLDLPDLREVGD